MSEPFNTPEAPVSWGELIDKITILEIKSVRMTAPQAIANVNVELHLLNGKAQAMLAARSDVVRIKQELTVVNESLWDIEDKIREKEAVNDFGEEFIALARAVYKTNDHRAAIKKEINNILQSKLVEEKSYAET